MVKKKNKKKSKKVVPLQERAFAFTDDEQTLLEKYSLVKHIVAFFPRHRRPPLRGRFGLWLFKKAGGVIDAQFFDKK